MGGSSSFQQAITTPRQNLIGYGTATAQSCMYCSFLYTGYFLLNTKIPIERHIYQNSLYCLVYIAKLEKNCFDACLCVAKNATKQSLCDHVYLVIAATGREN